MKKIKSFNQSERGQAAVEYVLLIAIIVSIIITLGLTLSSRIRDLLQGRVGNYIAQNFFDPNRMHVFPISIPND